jgi:EmrB/QacA subfamily drug resistance transporter
MIQKKIESHKSYRWFVLAIIAVGTFMATLDSSILNVALPSISNVYQTNINSLQWVVTAYLLTLSTLILIFGRISDMIGKSKIYNIGFIVFIFGSLLCALSQSLNQLILFRVIQAFGAGMFMANGMGIVTQIFPPQERGRALGLGGMVVAAGSLAGPSIGGLLVHSFGWKSIFIINLPIGFIGAIAALFILPRDNPEPKQTFDYLGALFFALTINCLTFGLAQLQAVGPEKIYPLVLLALGVISGGLFYWQEKRSPQPMVDLTLFQNTLFRYGSLAGLLSFIAMFFTIMLMPFYLQRILGLQVNTVGLMLTPFPLAMAFTAPLSGWLSDKLGHQKLTTIGMSLLFLQLLAMSTLRETTPIYLISIFLLIQGIAMGLFQSPNNSSIMGTVPRNKLGIASGINSTVRNVGMALGTNLSIIFFTFFYTGQIGKPLPAIIEKDKFMQGFHYVFLIAALVALLGTICTLKTKPAQATEGRVVS